MKKWFIKTMIDIFILSICVVGFVTWQDPYNLYSWHDKRWMDSRFVTGGIIKNYDYDYAIIGSSMIQNMQMDWFRENGYKQPVKLTKGGMDVNEQLLCLREMQEYDKIVDILFNLDFHTVLKLNEIKPSSNIYPKYSFTSTRLDDWKYYFGHKVWAYYIPSNIRISLANKMNITLSQQVNKQINVDYIGEWIDKHTFPGKEKILEKYNIETNQDTQQNTSEKVSDIVDQSEQEMKAKVDTCIVEMKKYISPNHEFVVALPPYSVLYWAKQIKNEKIDEVMFLRNYFVSELLKVPGVTIIDLQSIPQTLNLDKYKDTTHYDLDIQKYYADSVLNKQHLIHNEEELKVNSEAILKNAEEFLLEN